MIYATQQDALLGSRLGSEAMWQRSGPTALRDLRAPHVEIGGTALPTLVMHLAQAQVILGTCINSAFPLSIQCAAKPVQDAVSLPSIAEMVETIRSAFGLNVTQLAGVLGIERVTVYAWLRTEGADKLHPSNRDRLQSLYRIATEWSSCMPLAGRFLVDTIPGYGKSLLDLLSADDLNSISFPLVYEKLATAMVPSARIRSHRAEQKAQIKEAANRLRENVEDAGMDLS